MEVLVGAGMWVPDLMRAPGTLLSWICFPREDKEGRRWQRGQVKGQEGWPGSPFLSSLRVPVPGQDGGLPASGRPRV